jgi:hypothetical protein
MKVKMLKNTRGSENGHTVNTYKKGEVYNLPKVLAQHFIDTKVAEQSTEKVTSATREPSADNATEMLQANLYERSEDDIDAEEADKQANIVRPELTRPRQMAARAQRKVDVNAASTKREDDKGAGTKSLKATDYQNKAQKGSEDNK